MTKQKTKNIKKRQRTADRVAAIQEKFRIAPAYGVTTRLTLGQYICQIFDDQINKHRCDDKIAKMLRKEFPLKADVEYERYLNMYRNLYNRGEWPCQQSQKPANPIVKYDEGGKVVKAKSGPSPRMDPQEVE